MNIHYFQRYNKKEDVSTANTMLLLSRLYAHSAERFYQFLKDLCFADIEFAPDMSFVLQDRGEKSVPDATIGQPSFKIVVETKMYDWFYQDQLIRHLEKFRNEEYKVLITLSSEPMDISKKEEIDGAIEAYNRENRMLILHVNTTFEELASIMQDTLSDRDYEMQEILDDYLDYCRHDGLIRISYAWKWMRMQLAGTTFDFNVRENVYYDNINRGFSEHDYLGLYRQKSVRAIGKISAIITAVLKDDEFEYKVERGELNEERKQKIALAFEDGKRYGYVLDAQRYFFVEKFYETDFPKITKRPPMGTRFFNLEEILGVNKDSMPDTAEIAERLRSKDWS